MNPPFSANGFSTVKNIISGDSPTHLPVPIRG